MKGKPCSQVYTDPVERLAVLEKLALEGRLDLFYGDESGVCSEGYVAYGWQFPGERVCILAQKGHKVNWFGLISRQSQCHYATTIRSINSQFIMAYVEDFSLKIHKETVVVLDCARVHTGRLVAERLSVWQARGLFIFFLPPYSPHLNLAETLWRKLKSEWLVPEDYIESDLLLYRVNRCLANVGHKLTINFSPFNLN